ncbi:AbrB/MazE/SpoVT family DNA-binding domain-containing protein [Candidatus Woesearchaeota archaeon]|nr:AbrB/MazE/SpoVT family DNA-binding domain-containing protein [Candidatus Woesearchaeota archaeon]
MQEFEVTKLGERGQLVIPQEFRRSLGLHQGDKFIVVGRRDTLVLKRISATSMREFEFMLKKGHSHAAKNRIKESDMDVALGKARNKK